MHKSLLAPALLLAFTGCAATIPSPGPAPATNDGLGAVAPRLAVDAFLDAVRTEDLQAMGATWGTSQGPARQTIERTELEKRVIILQCYLQHDSYRVLNETPGEAGRRVIRVEITRGSEKRSPALHTVQGPRGRWYVENVELAAVRDFCGLQSSTP
ncbi:MAG: hypothetical protein ACR2L6_04315 [Gemmatimonadaceae bacterium]